MPITSSAKKALRASEHKAVFNTRKKRIISDIVKRFKKLIAEKKLKEAQALLPEAYKAIDKAGKINLLHKNTSAHKKSCLARMLARASE